MDMTSAASALSPMPATLAGFDYAAFLQAEDEPGLSTEHDDPSSSTLSDGGPIRGGAVPSALSSGNSSTGQELTSRTPEALAQAHMAKQRMERRGHTKSRRGCFNCKRRRIKCQETQPACGHCLKSGLTCEYPNTPRIVHQPHHQIPLFSLQDMRFFQHFLTQCYPHQPIGNEDIWTHEIPCLSQTHEYLMHAILGVAACDLASRDKSLLPFAVQHRMHAIRAIKKALAEMPRRNTTPEEANAMIASCFALTFQSVTFNDGMVEFMVFIRGILIVGMQMWVKGLRPLFSNMIDDAGSGVLEPFMANLPLIPLEWSEGASMSVRDLRPLCRDEMEVEYHDLLLQMSDMLQTSSWQAYKALGKQYTWWMMLPHEKFQKVINLSNQTMVLLATHWIALKQIMAKITEHEQDARTKSPPPQQTVDQGMIRWLRYLNALVDFEHLVYNAWPLWVQEQLDRDVSFFGRTAKMCAAHG